MATFLKICQNVARECSVAGGADASPRPTTVVGQSGELNRIVNWVRDAYIEIQGARDWRWLRKDFTFDTVSGTDTYAYSVITDVDDSAVISRFRAWRLNDRMNPPKIYLTSAGVGGQSYLVFSRWDRFSSVYKIGAIQDQTSQPITITYNPKDEIVLGMTPNDIYTVTGSYYLSAQILAADADVPELPAMFHDLIKYQAMMYYGLFESAPEIISRAQIGAARLMNQLKRDQEPKMRFGGPLA